MTHRARRSTFFFCLLPLLAVAARAQLTSVAGSQAQPIPGAGHDYIHLLSETINPANGALSIRIAVPTPPGRGISVPFAFGYDSNAAHHSPVPLFGSVADNPGYLSKGGWIYLVPQLSVIRKDNSWTTLSPRQTFDCYYFTDYMLIALDGQVHPLNISAAEALTASNCTGIGYPPATGVRPAQHPTGSYDRFQATTPADPGPSGNPSSMTAADMDGTVYYFSNSLSDPFHFITSSQGGFSMLPDWIEDRNGNRITFTDDGNGKFSVTDTLGRSLLTSSGFGTTGNTVTVSGIANPYTVTWGSSSSNWSYNTQTTYDGGSGSCASLNGTYMVTLPEITSIELPNGTSYQFQYDAVSGLLSKIIYPTGAYVRYLWGTYPMSDYLTYNDSNNTLDTCHMKYDTQAVTDRYVSFDGVNEVLHQQFTYDLPNWIPDGVTPTSENWTLKKTTVQTYDRGTSFKTVYAYQPGRAFNSWNDPFIYTSNNIPVEDTISYYGTTGSLLRTVTKSFVGGIDLPPDVKTTLNDTNQVSQTTHVYGSCSGGVPCGTNYPPVLRDEYDYDFGSGSPGPLLRHTHIDYASFADSPIFSSAPSILDQPSDVIVYDGSGNRVAETDYGYDQSTVTSVSSTQHDEANYGASSTAPRGNVTLMTRKCLQSCTDAATTLSYDETGQISSETDPKGSRTSYSYADSPSGGNPAGNSNAYLTTVTYPPVNGVTLHKYFQYAYSDGNLTQSRDDNDVAAGKATGYQYNDSLGRLKETDYPDGGVTQYSYDDSVPSVTTAKFEGGSTWMSTVDTMDGVGHTIQTQASDPAGPGYTDTLYDGESRIYQQSNPTRCSSTPGKMPGSCAESTWGITTYDYDALGRRTLQVNPDQSQEQWSYDGNVTTFTDENGSSWKRQYDALGRLTKVLEPDGAHQTPSMETDYTYDALGDLLKVDQLGDGSSGARVRTFTYDSLSRLLCASSPENSTGTCPTTASAGYTTGTVGYTYDADGNVATKTSPAVNGSSGSQTIGYCYDALNRMTYKFFSASFSCTSPSGYAASYGYDTSALSGSANDKGHLTDEKTYINSTLIAERSPFQYDLMGRLKVEQQCTISNCNGGSPYVVSYSYDLAGNLTYSSTGLPAIPGTSTPLGFTASYDSAGRLQATQSSWTPELSQVPNSACLFSAQTAVSATTPGCTQTSTTPYAAFGGLMSASYGNGVVTLNRNYDNRLRVTGETDYGKVSQ
jgi:YD repeat-containing protein